MNFIYLIIFLCFFLAKVFATTIEHSQIQQTLDTLSQTHQLPGVQISIKDIQTEEFWSFSSGYSNIKNLEPLKNDHLMQIGSVTKSFIASLVLLLEADSQIGCLELEFNIDQTVGYWLPEYPEWETIKIRQLLNMTSGIHNYTIDSELFETMLNNPQRIWKNSELVNMAYSHSPNIHFLAGTDYAYCNTNYILIGMILEKVSAQSLEQLINERIFKKYPDYFKHTAFSSTNYPQKQISNMAHGYAMDNHKHPEFYEQDITSISLSWAGAAGAITSTASDLTNWVELLFSDDFLPEKQRKELESLVCIDKKCKAGVILPNDSKLKGYGLGVSRVHDLEHGYIWTHTGGTLGYHTIFMYLPQKSLVISVIINQMGPKIDGKEDVIVIAKQILNLIKFE